ncbi:methyltransferase domain-containing protein [Luteococcus sp. H138]|uniref:class I SAM-dependent methyltransferase n=1 Tax=unclassified Luteococcus TaxID=2639923 RepID=UPI00313C9B2E
MSQPQQPEGQEVSVDWDEAREANRLNWDDRAAIHATSYGIEAYVTDPERISDQVRADHAVLREHLPGGSVDGLDLVHLQCHIGTDTISWARLGARVVGLDLSPASLEVARDLASQAGANVTWVQSDALAARAAVEGNFDVVYTSIGAICWLPDLDRWAQQIVALLRPGGLFYIQDGHPMLYALDDTGAEPRVRYRYFPTGQAQAWDDPGTYLGDGQVAHPRSYEWPHSLAEILGSLLRAGLVIRHFDEGQTLPWRFSPAMRETERGWMWPTPDQIPCTFTIVAHRP